MSFSIGYCLFVNRNRPLTASERTFRPHTGRHPPLKSLAAGLMLWAACAAATKADEARPGANAKSQYTLFNPTPDRLLRDLTTDRPDTTESPFTVDAGRVQIETNIFGFARSRPDSEGAVSDTYEFGTTNIRIGLTHAAEIGVVWQPYGIVRTQPGDGTDATRSKGVGGLDIRGKFNFWGNDNFEKPGDTALALLPYVTFPTQRGNGISPETVSGGFIVPFAVKLSDRFTLGLNGGLDFVRAEDSTRYHTEQIASASLSYSWAEQLSTYYEIATRFGTNDPRGNIVIVATGVAYQLTKNLQFDAGINIGVTDAADRFNPFVGVSARF